LYIPLRARLELPRGETWQEEVRLAGRRLSDEEKKQMRLSEPQPVLDVLREHAGLILLGDPGAGKSTFLKFLTLQLALGQGKPLGLGDRLPVLVPLAAYANALEEADVRLDDFIASYFCQTCGDLPVDELLADALKAGKALVLLDGLDEVKKLALRGTVVERAITFYNFHRRSGNKFVLTSRIIGYREVRPSADDLLEGTLVDLAEDEIADFVERWTAALERQAQGQESSFARSEAEREKGELLAAIQHNPGVRQLASNPLLLTILAVMKRQGVTLPERRVELYDQYVKTMLSVWNRARSLSGRTTGPEVDVVQTVRVLAPLARWMHEANPGVGLVRREDLRRKLVEIYAARGEQEPETAANAFLTDVHEHTGLLLERGPGEYGFIHLTFEEYLSGVALALEGQGDPAALVEKIAPLAGIPAWREALLLSISYVAQIQQLDRVAMQVIETLAETRTRAELAVIAGEACVDLQSSGFPPAARQNVQQSLLHFMKDAGHTPTSLRARAGTTLGRLGDPRFRTDFFCLADEPLLGFVEIPAGPFQMGSDPRKDQQAADAEQPQHTVSLGSFLIARYPVTVAQFRAFVEDSAYQLDYPGSLRGIDNHPIVGITWHEALAYCDWLAGKLRGDPRTPPALRELLETGGRVTLPSEAEWEKAARGMPAARGTDGRIYPWGNDFD
ncbi:MAG: SUMF1/EgtB/PvdO family nonheme iron enzyme, partial [Anaerolineaceae bacterium]|nr:SUMF1/EgtB/PvdO family nonheme iron enzyme [Anaerolineaceae bacterium]